MSVPGSAVIVKVFAGAMMTYEGEKESVIQVLRTLLVDVNVLPEQKRI